MKTSSLSLLSFLTCLAASAPLSAGLAVFPDTIILDGPGARQSIVVQQSLAPDAPATDVTSSASLSAGPEINIDGPSLVAVSSGTSSLTISVGSESLTIPVEIRHAPSPPQNRTWNLGAGCAERRKHVRLV